MKNISTLIAALELTRAEPKDGEPGAVGPQGVVGERGAVGPQGEAGAMGPPGVDGLPGLVGERGAVGPQGERGDQGRTGRDGLKGDKGDTGKRGAVGSQGPQGPKGEPGADGKDGVDGEGFNWRGPWQRNAQYEPRDVVQFSGSSWVCIRTTDAEPSLENAGVWELMALRGATGADGASPSIDLSLYLTVEDATEIYLSQADAATTYLTQDDAGAYLAIDDAASTYETQSHASSTYETQSHATTTFETQSHAASTYALISALAGYLTTSSAASTYETQSHAASTYETQSHASSTYALASALAGYLPLTGGTLSGPLESQVNNGVDNLRITNYNALAYGFLVPLRVRQGGPGNYETYTKFFFGTDENNWSLAVFPNGALSNPGIVDAPGGITTPTLRTTVSGLGYIGLVRQSNDFGGLFNSRAWVGIDHPYGTHHLRLQLAGGTVPTDTGADGELSVFVQDTFVTQLRQSARTGNMAIGTDLAPPAAGGSKLLVDGDVEAKDIGDGFILQSPDGTRWRITVDNAGVLSTVAA